MTRRTASRITELEIRNTGMHFFGFEDGVQVVDAIALTERAALDELVKRNWKRVSLIVLLRDGWQCRLCGSMHNLQAHHIKFRSHGRVDVPSNLACLCNACHEDVHQRKKKVPETPWSQ